MSESPVQSILVIDDEQAIREALKYRLQHLGYEVEATGEAPQALERVQANAYGVVLLDVRMPHGSGLDLITPTPAGFARHSNPRHHRLWHVRDGGPGDEIRRH